MNKSQKCGDNSPHFFVMCIQYTQIIFLSEYRFWDFMYSVKNTGEFMDSTYLLISVIFLYKKTDFAFT